MRSAKAKDRERQKPFDLRTVIQENDQRIYSFCALMLQGGYPVEELTLSVFRKFREFCRRTRESSGELYKLTLFKIAWDQIEEAIERTQYRWTVGRDTRATKSQDTNLYQSWKNVGAKGSAPIAQNAAERLWRIDPDFRAPLILHDVFRLTDEEAMQVLGLRWGVFRHRLHRGRAEFAQVLRGDVPMDSKSSVTAFA